MAYRRRRLSRRRMIRRSRRRRSVRGIRIGYRI